MHGEMPDGIGPRLDAGLEQGAKPAAKAKEKAPCEQRALKFVRDLQMIGIPGCADDIVFTTSELFDALDTLKTARTIPHKMADGMSRRAIRIVIKCL